MKFSVYFLNINSTSMMCSMAKSVRHLKIDLGLRNRVRKIDVEGT
jgi:hypothetical protein